MPNAYAIMVMVEEIEMIMESIQNSHPILVLLRLLLDRSHEWGEAPLPAIAGLMLMLPTLMNWRGGGCGFVARGERWLGALASDGDGGDEPPGLV